jgi:hypothetical protein
LCGSAISCIVLNMMSSGIIDVAIVDCCLSDTTVDNIAADRDLPAAKGGVA